MRVRGSISCAAAVGVVLAAAGCGGDDGGGDGPVAASVPVVPSAGTTVTTTATVTVPEPTTTAPVTVTRRAPAATTGSTGPSRPRSARPVSVPPPTTPTRPTTSTTADDDSDPVGGTTFSPGTGRGTGYTVRVPDGWFDGSRRLEGSGVPFDLSYVRGRGSEVVSNILIVRDGGAADAGQDIEDLARSVRRDTERTSGSGDITRGADTTIDGEAAISYVIHRDVGSQELVQRRIAVLHRRDLFTVTLTSLDRDAAADGAVFRSFLRSWRWE
jgi:hypothetical protein